MPHKPPPRHELHRQFVERFDRRYHPRQPIPPGRIQAVESELGIALPNAYKEFLNRYGCISTNINMALRCGGPYHPELEGFTVFDHIVQVVRLGWSTVIPAHIAGAAGDINGNVFEFVLPFAEAECGNYFCFPRRTTPADDLPVYLFDHDTEPPNVNAAASSFDDLLWWYIENLTDNPTPQA